MEVTVVGGGISGVACANALASSGIPVVLRDRGRGLGGRMASRILRDTGTPFDGRPVDIGASYFTARDPLFSAQVDQWVAAGVVRPWTDAFHVATPEGIEGVRSGPMRYAAPRGLRSVVESTVRDDVDVRSGDDVAELPDDQVVALCMPLPQAHRLSDRVPDSSITWEPVIAVTCVFEERAWITLDGVFVNDDPVLTWIADDGRRRGDDAPVLVLHVNPVLSAGHLDDPAGVIPQAVAALRRILGITAYPAWVDAHRWTFAKPLAAHPEPFWLSEDGRIGVAGDLWADGPRVEAAWLSGTALGEALASRMAGA
ncbi:MAG TPA: NAD/FAD-dependent oxidoreductase [Actinobacteria bacterium]|jgi:predicted NAD/FAD-dependent oxidoreductase|nr:NAD/FAD-dependent oxidoreductase [Actinomycetota bacterium]